MKKVTILIGTCFACPRYGSMPKGGPTLPVCFATLETFGGISFPRTLPNRFNDRTGGRDATGVIPDWCPLPNSGGSE